MNYYIIGLLILFIIITTILIIVYRNKESFVNTDSCPYKDGSEGQISCCYDDNGTFKGTFCNTPGYYIAKYDSDAKTCSCSAGWQMIPLPNERGLVCTEILENKTKIDYNKEIYQDKTSCPEIQCNPGYIGDNCENIIDTQNFTRDNVLNILNNLDYVRNNYASSFEKLFDTFPYSTYVLVYCIPSTQPLRSKYYNFCSNGGKNYYDANTPINDFHNSIYGQDYGDLIYNYNDNVGFWWNSLNGDNCSDHGGEQHYISVKPDGILASLSSYQNNKNQNYNYFENIINKDTYLPISRGYGYKNLGVLLIGPEPLKNN